jgi:hypothetical protein
MVFGQLIPLWELVKTKPGHLIPTRELNETDSGQIIPSRELHERLAKGLFPKGILTSCHAFSIIIRIFNYYNK